MAFQSSLLTLLKSDASLHFPSPAYGEARDGALATAPRGGNGGGAFSPFSVVVAVGLNDDVAVRAAQTASPARPTVSNTPSSMDPKAT